MYAPLFSVRATCPDPLVLLDLITHTLFCEECKSWRSSLCNQLHSPVSSKLLGPSNIFLTTFSRISSACVLPSMWEAKFHTHTKQRAKLYSVQLSLYTECSTRYRTRHFFNNSNTNEDIATKFEQEYVRCVRNEEECVCSPLQISIKYPH